MSLLAIRQQPHYRATFFRSRFSSGTSGTSGQGLEECTFILPPRIYTMKFLLDMTDIHGIINP